LDFSVAKEIPFRSEVRKLQFRAESFNLTNDPNFDLPINVFDAPTFGQIVTTNAFGNKPPRQIQLGLKFVFLILVVRGRQWLLRWASGGVPWQMNLREKRCLTLGLSETPASFCGSEQGLRVQSAFRRFFMLEVHIDIALLGEIGGFAR
jgi:hypothetical protein